MSVRMKPGLPSAEKERGWSTSNATKPVPTGLDFARPVGRVATTLDQASADLRAYIQTQINSNNNLGLPESEIKSIVDMLVQTPNKSEIFDWATTLMLPESFAMEVVRQREVAAARFAQQEEEEAAAAADDASVYTEGGPSATARKNAGRGKRGKAVDLAAINATTGTGVKPLVRGQQFECGCFATAHPLKGNCFNCGRIICQQEAADVCYSCGLNPARCFARELKVTLGEIDAAAEQRNRASMEAAVAKRDELLQFAKERARRTLVIDDQSGFVAHRDVFASKAEREETDARALAERQRVSEMHRHTGVYTLHMDIVNECVSLGAAALQEKRRHEEEEKARPQISGFAAPDGNDDDDEAATGVASAPPALEAAAVDEGARPLADADDTRVMPLPSLMQRVFYCASEAEAEQRCAIKGARVSKTTTAAPAADGADPDAAVKAADTQARPGMQRAREADGRPAAVKGRVNAAADASRRVQIDYYEDDAATFAMVAQEDRILRKGGVAGGGRFGAVGGGGAATTLAQQLDEQDAEEARRNELLLDFRMDSMPNLDAPLGAPTAAASAQVDAGLMEDATAAAAAAGGASSSAAAAVAAQEEQRRIRTLSLKDEGWCLSMHQPWASLLVAGIKRHEGRTWSSPWRGRLWIHAAAAKPQDVEAIEAIYRPFAGPDMKFPTHYPTRCLLGCVTVTDCLDLEAYEARFTPAERQEESPFKFICAAPKALSFHLQMEGDHKIFKLDRKIWAAARKLMGEGPPK